MFIPTSPAFIDNFAPVSNASDRAMAKTHNLAGQTAVTIRLVLPTDLDLLVDLHGRLSDESLYKRYLRSYRPTVEEIEFIVNLPASQGTAIMATKTLNQREVAIGLAYYVIEDVSFPFTAEPAFIVDDWYQGQGIGTQLFEALRQTAVAHQVRAFNVVMHPANGTMMRIFMRSGLPLRQSRGFGEREVTIRLQPSVNKRFRETAVLSDPIYQ